MNLSNINKVDESYTFVEFDENGNVYETTVIFSKELHSLLKTQFDISFGLIDKKVKSFQTEPEKMSSILNLQISHCIGMRNRINENVEFSKYADIDLCLKILASRLIERYSPFINADLCCKIDPVKYAKPTPEKLTWNGDRETFIKLFYDHVIKHNITLNNSDAYEPVYEKLASFFNIKPKSNKLGRPPKDINESGFIKESSVIANFKAAGNSPKKTK